MLLNTEKWQGYSFYRFWVIIGKPTGGVKLSHHTYMYVEKIMFIHTLNPNATFPKIQIRQDCNKRRKWVTKIVSKS